MDLPAGWGFEQSWTLKWRWEGLLCKEPGGRESEGGRSKSNSSTCTWSLGTKKEIPATMMRMTEGKKVWLMWKVSFLWDIFHHRLKKKDYKSFLWCLKWKHCITVENFHLQGKSESKTRKKRTSPIAWEPKVTNSHLCIMCHACGL